MSSSTPPTFIQLDIVTRTSISFSLFEPSFQKTAFPAYFWFHSGHISGAVPISREMLTRVKEQIENCLLKLPLEGK